MEDVNWKYNTPFCPDPAHYTEFFCTYFLATPGGLKTAAWRDNDVITTAYHRSGTHLLWMLTRMILHGQGQIPKDIMEESHVMFKNFKPDTQAHNSMRVLNTHDIPAEFTLDAFLTGNRKFITMFRNAKDVAVSQYHLYHKMEIFKNVPNDIGQFLEEYVYADDVEFSWFKHVRAWEEFTDKYPQAPVLLLFYEDYVKTPEIVLRKIANFLDVTLDDATATTIVNGSDVATFLKAALADGKGDTLSEDTYKAIYNKGIIGNWKNYLTVAQSDRFDDVYRRKMEGSKLRFDGM